MSFFSVNYLGGGRFDPPFFPTFTQPYPYGCRYDIPSTAGDAIFSERLAFDTELLSLSIAASRYDTEDSWSIRVGTQEIAHRIYMKLLPQSIFLMVAHPIPANTDIQLIYNNGSGYPKVVLFDYHFLRGE